MFKILVVVMGSGRLGSNLASALIADGHDVTLIEIDEATCREVASQLDVMVICGNGTDRRTLESAQIDEADAFVAATGNDEVNLLASLLAREYKPEKIIARVNEPHHEKVFMESEMVDTVSPECTTAGYLEKLILKPDVADLYVVDKGKAELLEIYVKNKKLIGKKIGDLSPNDDYIICGVYENGEEDIKISQPDMILKEGDRVSVLVKRDAMKKVLNIFI